MSQPACMSPAPGGLAFLGRFKEGTRCILTELWNISIKEFYDWPNIDLKINEPNKLGGLRRASSNGFAASSFFSVCCLWNINFNETAYTDMAITTQFYFHWYFLNISPTKSGSLGHYILYIKLQNGMFKNTNKYLKDQNNVSNMTALAFPLYENTKQRTCILYKVLAVSIIITS